MPGRILIVDDNISVLDTYKSVCESFGFTVETAERGAIAIDLAQNSKPDLVLLDLAMPEMNGVETMYKLREVHADLPIYIITAYYDKYMIMKKIEDASKNMEFEVCHKPLGAKKLREILVSVFGSVDSLDN